MKKNYLFAVLFAFGMLNANAQFALDDMESYGGANTPIFAGPWGSWGGTTADALVSSSNQAQSGSLSGYVDGSTVTDALLLLGDKIFGSWGLKYSMYIPAGKEGYMNMQGVEAAGVQFVVGNWYYNEGGAVPGEGNISDTANGLVTFSYPEDQWFDVTINLDFNQGAGASTWAVWVDDVEVVAPGTPYSNASGEYAQSVGAIDFYSISANNEYYIDDAEYRDSFFPDPTLSVDDLSTVGFSAYPNPVKDVLNLRANEEISSAVIYNVLGQEVYNANINALNATVNMASFASGAYFVKVIVGGTEGVVKVLK
jgi:hypothetical protein